MSLVPDAIDADSGPPMTIPLRHFLVGLGFLLAGAVMGLVDGLDAGVGLWTLAETHLLFVGWVMVTVMGAMTQFVPVWSGTRLHSRRLATLQLALVAPGVAGFATALSLLRLALLPVFGALMLAGFWVFAYNLARTLATARPFDDTERHFAFALAALVVVTAFGFLLAFDLATPVLAAAGVDRTALRSSHLTLAVFGVVLVTVVGALSQLAAMFTQTDRHPVDRPLERVERIGLPVGVALLAGGRLLADATVARVGAVLLVVALLAFAAVLARRLAAAAVPRTPMLTRYAVVAAALALWAVATLPAWLADPLAASASFGAPGTVHLLSLGVVGFVVTGTLYHVVPFIVWVHRYSDRLGLEPVPMIDDLYDDRLARLDFAALTLGLSLLVLGDATAAVGVAGVAAGGTLSLVGFMAFAANVALVVHRHAPQSLPALLLGARPPAPAAASLDD